MKILFLNHNVIGRGTFQRAFGFARELARHGHQVTLVTTSPALRRSHIEESRQGVTLIQSPDLLSGKARTGWDPWNTGWRVSFLRNKRFDIVHAFDSRPAVIIPALATRLKSRSKLVLDWADWWGRGGTISERSDWLTRQGFAPIETWFEESFRTKADGNTVISSALAARAVSLGVPPDRVIQLVNGADLDLVPMVDKRAARARLKVDRPEAPIIGSLGHLNSDGSFLFEVFRHVAAVRPDSRLLVIGDRDNPVPPRYPFKDRVLTPGYVRDTQLPDYLGICDLFVLPMRDIIANRGRWPGKIGDYLAAGRPTVATAVGEMARVMQGEEGVVTVPPTTQTVVEAVLELVDDPAKAERLGSSARRAAEERLSWTDRTIELEAFYGRI